MDKYLATDKDNLFVGWKWTTVDQMSYMRDATLTYELETNTGFSVQAMARHRNDQPAGQLQYWKNNGETPGQWDEKNTLVHDITTTELGVTLRYAPGETFVNTKQRRVPVSLDAPTFTLSHTAGFKGVLGGEYNFNLTEASIRKRFWLGSWGKLDVTARAGAQWNTVPFPLLNLPMANLSYITQNNESFNLINNMEFLNDRYASLNLSYDMNGKLFNRIPLIKKLKWREMFRIRGLWGTLTDKTPVQEQQSRPVPLPHARRRTHQPRHGQNSLCGSQRRHLQYLQAAPHRICTPTDLYGHTGSEEGRYTVYDTDDFLEVTYYATISRTA